MHCHTVYTGWDSEPIHPDLAQMIICIDEGRITDSFGAVQCEYRALYLITDTNSDFEVFPTVYDMAIFNMYAYEVCIINQ